MTTTSLERLSLWLSHGTQSLSYKKVISVTQKKCGKDKAPYDPKEAWQSHMSLHDNIPKQKVVLERSETSHNGGVRRHSLSALEQQRAKQEQWGELGPWVTCSFSSPTKNGGKNHSGKPLLHSIFLPPTANLISQHSLLPFLPLSLPVLQVPLGGSCMRVMHVGDLQRVPVSVCLLQASLLSKLDTASSGEGSRKGMWRMFQREPYCLHWFYLPYCSPCICMFYLILLKRSMSSWLNNVFLNFCIAYCLYLQWETVPTVTKSTGSPGQSQLHVSSRWEHGQAT